MEYQTREFVVRKYSESEDLLSRDQGKRILEGIRLESGKLNTGGVLILDFQGIRYATIDCLMEILTFLDMSMQREFRERYAVLRLGIANSGIEDSLAIILNQKRAAIPSIDENGNWRILGRLTKAQRDALEIVCGRPEVTSTEMSDLLSIPINAASNRLKDLYDMRLVSREEGSIYSVGRRQFVYRCVASMLNRTD